ncbi:MAG: HD-GYP domain-containing protein [Gammaproteobacteria bacterium]|nr:MAG: HD-GYP domain-containing protein [Gammaproteobacteria bacterium]
MSVRKIHTTDLKPGMFVVKVSSESLSLPQSFQNFHIKSKSDIARLIKAQIKTVYVDDSKSKEEKPVASAAGIVSGPSKELKQELQVAQKVQEKAKETINKVMDMALQDQPVEAKMLTPVVNQTFESLTRNDQALLTLMHMKRHGQVLLSHAFSVLSLATAVANRLKYSYEEIELLGMAAMMYDVGWVRMPANLVSKDKPYTEKELKLVHQHPIFSETITKKSEDLPEEVIRIIKEHHEFLDGTGYPHKLKGDQISELAHILCVVDYYDAMVHGFMGYQGRTPNAALKVLYKASQEGKIDNKIIVPLVHVLGVYPLTSAVQLNTGERGIVIEMNRKSPVNPTVKICYDPSIKPLIKPIIVNLAAQEGDDSRKIEGIIDPNAEGIDPFKILKMDEGEG